MNQNKQIPPVQRVPWTEYTIQGRQLIFTHDRGKYAYFIDRKGNTYYINAAGALVKK